jgi:hypothetical protein
VESWRGGKLAIDHRQARKDARRTPVDVIKLASSEAEKSGDRASVGPEH